VAIALIGERFARTTILFVGWFGPRGLASVVFAVIAFDSLKGTEAEAVLAAITLTVLLSVFAHGLSAAPLSRRYGDHVAALAKTTPEREAVAELATRSHTTHRHAPRAAVPELEE
jgi:NhaP-type Na+/H+ or K+/H+ antiporter